MLSSDKLVVSFTLSCENSSAEKKNEKGKNKVIKSSPTLVKSCFEQTFFLFLLKNFQLYTTTTCELSVFIIFYFHFTASKDKQTNKRT